MSERLHADEPAIDAALVRRLLAEQFPRWAELPLAEFDSPGTTNRIYRLGDDLVVRLPRVGYGVRQIEKERDWLPRLAPQLPLAIPVPLATGAPGAGYPFSWSVSPWLPGAFAEPNRLDEPRQAARDLAGFLNRLREIDPTGGPLAVEHDLRSQPLAGLDGTVRAGIDALADDIDVPAVTAAWDAALATRVWEGEPVWVHGDMGPGNVLVHAGHVSAVIDYGSLGVGDPACDLMIAWSLFSGDGRAAFRDALGVDDATWARGRGHAIAHALIYIPYYRHTMPEGCRTAFRQLEAALANCPT